MNEDSTGRSALEDAKPGLEARFRFGWALPVGRALAVMLVVVAFVQPDLMLKVALACLILQALGELSLPLLAALAPASLSRQENAECARGLCTTLISAHLDNEEPVLLESIAAFHAVGCDIVVASNGHNDCLVAELQRRTDITWTHDQIAAGKAVNINRAVVGESHRRNVLLADADTRPLIWSSGSNQMQGAGLLQFPRLIRLQCRTYIERVISIEFAIKTLLTYPSRFRSAGVVYFGGSAARCSQDLLKTFGFRPGLLVEDIDFSIRSLLAGHTVAYSQDRIFTELAPPSVAGWITQRARWASGWLQLCSLHTRPLLTSSLPLAARALWSYLLVWRRLIVPTCLLASIAALVAGATPWPTLVLACAAIQLSALVRAGVVHAWYRATVSLALGESSATAIILYCLSAVPYTIALYFIDLSVLFFPVKSWSITPRTRIKAGERSQDVQRSVAKVNKER